MKKTKIKYTRAPFLSWIILPILGVLLATNYIFGLTRRPTWAIIYDNDPSSANLESVTSPSSEEKADFEWNGEGLITFWFDDAWISQYAVAFPILKKSGFPAALAVPTSAINWDGYMTWAQIKRVKYNGWEITAHSRSHECDLIKLNHDKLVDELAGSQMDLLEKGYKTDIYVEPCGVGNEELIKTAKDYYLSLRTTEEGLNSIPLADPYSLKIVEVGNNTNLKDIENWVNQAKISKSWLIIMFHKIEETGYEYTTPTSTLESIVNTVSKSGLRVILPSQALNINK